MATAWRIVRARRAATAFTGEGARLFGGRWSSPGTRVVYVSEHQSTAALETLVHALPAGVEQRYKAFQLEWPDELTEKLSLRKLPADWRASPASRSTMQIGDTWTRERRSAVLAVPSAITPADTNFLLNPEHPDFAQIRVRPAVDFEFDPRLLRE
jgi:RES domain-containing protein